MQFLILSPHPEAHMMGFAFRTDGGKLLVIDGGMEDLHNCLNAYGYLWDELRRLTGSDRPHVDAWILTHPHEDHVSELRRMCLAHPGGFSIGALYQHFPDVDRLPESSHVEEKDREYQRQFIRDYDSCFGSGAFAALKQVKAGDRFALDGLTVEFLYVPPLDRVTNMNNASIVFRVTVKGQVFLFMGDTGISGGVDLAEACGDALRCDVCQVAHHGHGGARELVYTFVKPRVSIICTQKSLWDDRANNALAAKITYPEIAASRLLITGVDGPCTFDLPMDTNKVGRRI